MKCGTARPSVTPIPTGEVTFHPHSYGDPAGRLFVWNGGLYRGIRGESAPFFRRLLEDGTVQGLVDDGLLIDTEMTPLSLAGFDMVVRHRSLPFPSYPEEWSGTMLRDAALLILDMLERLAARGLTLKDGHPWNVLYDACRPTYVDLTSIAPVDDRRWRGYDSFCHFCVYPLVLISQGQERIARRLIPEYEGVLAADLEALTRRSPLSPLRRWRRAASRLWRRVGDLERLTVRSPDEASPADSRQRKAAAFARRVRQDVRGIVLDERGPDEVRPALSWSSAEHAAVADVLDRLASELQPASVLEALSRPSYSSVLAADRDVVSLDPDSACISRLYRDGQQNKRPMLPLVMDFTDPTPARGLAAHWTIPASERLRCDMVLGLGLVQYGVVQRRLRFEQIVDGLAGFCRRWLVVDFPEHPRGTGADWLRARTWYSLEHFMRVVRERFGSVTRLPTGSGVLLLCEK